MTDTRYLTWHYFPLHLDADESSDPLRVIDLFFNVCSLPGHLRLLRKWRKYIIGEGYYIGANGHPSDLLMVHADFIRLIEAAYLLNGLKDDHQKLSIKEADEIRRQITHERNTWNTYPASLSHKQIAEPMRVLKKFCNCYTLPEYRMHLKEWLIYGLSVTASDEYLIAADLVNIYEGLQMLAEACWLMHMRKNHPVSIPPDRPDEQNNDEPISNEQNTLDYELNE